MENSTNNIIILLSIVIKCGGLAETLTCSLRSSSLSYQTHRSVGLEGHAFMCFKKILSWTHHMAGGILVPQPGITLAPPAVQAGSLNHRAVREVHHLYLMHNFYKNTEEFKRY